MQLRFTKMHGLGNDFVVIDLLSQNATLSAANIRYIADRHFGIGCDQVLLIEPPKTAATDFHYRIFNCDGNEVEQCGNGARCVGKFVADKKLTGKRQLAVSTNTGLLNIELLDSDTVRVGMGVPEFDPANVPFLLGDSPVIEGGAGHPLYRLDHQQGSSEVGIVSMGNPHAVLLVDDVADAPVNTLGPILENHSQFPNRANIGFMQILSRKAIKLRVFERGVGETSACGSGACAAVASGIARGLLDPEVDVELTGGHLTIQWQGNDKDSTLVMTGNACKVFDGKIKL